MASANGIPPNAAAARGQSEEEPLLGRRGDASQAEGQPLYQNLWIGPCLHILSTIPTDTNPRHRSSRTGRHLDPGSHSLGRDPVQEIDLLLRPPRKHTLLLLLLQKILT